MGLRSIAKKTLGAASGTFGIGTALGVAGLAGDYLAAKSLQGDAQSFNAREAQRTREFQKYVMQNQIQWRYADLEKAGINPILAAQMSGMTSPSGGAAGSPVANQNAVSTALQAARLAADIRQVNASTEKLKAETRSTNQNITILEPLELFRDLIMKGIDWGTNTFDNFRSKEPTSGKGVLGKKGNDGYSLKERIDSLFGGKSLPQTRKANEAVDKRRKQKKLIEEINKRDRSKYRRNKRYRPDKNMRRYK